MADELFSWRNDPGVPPFPDEHPLLVFDGQCVLCSANAQLVMRHDRKRLFRLTTAQGPLGQALYRHFGLSAGLDGTMLLISDGRLYVESDAAIRMAALLGGPFSFAGAGRLMPAPLRDGIYRLVARNRFRLFGRREQCWVPTPDIADRIL